MDIVTNPPGEEMDMTERIRVLVIDEDPLLLEVAKERLQKEGAFDVQTALSGEDGLKLLRCFPFDAVISAHQMRGMNGLELLKRIRADQPKMPFILFTSNGGEEIMIEAFDHGADGYLQKGGTTDSVFCELTSKVRAIVERRRMEVELSRSEARYRSLFEAAKDGILIMNGDLGTVEDANTSIIDKTGYSIDELKGKKLWELGFIKDRTLAEQAYRELKRDGHFRSDALSLWTKTGGVFEVESIGNSYSVDGKSIVQWYFRDISDRQRTLDDLAETASKLSLATRAGAMGIWDWDIVHDRMTWDEQMFALYGRTSESLHVSYHAWISSLHPDDAKECKEEVSAALRGDEEFDTEFRVVWPDGTIHFLRGIATVICDASGMAVRMLGTNWDITRQKQAEEALRDSEDKFSTLFDKMLEGFAYCRMLFDENGIPEDFVHLTVNSAFDQIMGTKNVMNRRATEVFPGIKEAMPELFATYGRVAMTGISASFDLDFSKIGKWLHISVYSPAREFFVTVFEDITLRKQAETAIVQIKANFRHIFNNVNDGIHLNLMLPDGRPGLGVECNEVACQMLGYSYEELLRMSPSEYDTGKHDPPLEKIAEELCRNGQVKFHTEHRRKDGSMLPVDVNAHAISLDGRRLILAAIRDVTEGKHIEEALLQTNRNLNILTSITRHDTLNQTTVIQGYANLLEKMTLTPKQAEYVLKIERAAQAIQGQVEFTKQYQDIGAKAPKWQSIHETILKVKAALPLMTLGLRERKPDHSIHADPMFEKVVYNLIENCIRHSGGAKMMEITATEKDGSLHLVLEDDGRGIAPADREHLFERGFGKNTGYGLFLSREILKITGISINENSKEGKGARFEIVVPAGEWRTSER
ncbi:MAG: PAS domain S-box protein [Methanomassiliicoccales archaeon]